MEQDCVFWGQVSKGVDENSLFFELNFATNLKLLFKKSIKIC